MRLHGIEERCTSLSAWARAQGSLCKIEIRNLRKINAQNAYLLSKLYTSYN